jgi:hypothetical protein
MESAKNSDDATRFVFIQGPDLFSTGTTHDRRRIRSQLMRRVYMENLERKEQQVIQGRRREACVVQEEPFSGRSSSSIDRCVFCSSKTRSNKSEVCDRCLKLMDSLRQSIHRRTSGNHNPGSTASNTGYFPLIRLGAGGFDPFGGPANPRGEPAYYTLMQHCTFVIVN